MKIKNFFEKCGWGYIALFAMLLILIIGGGAMIGISVYGWFTGECDLGAIIGFIVGFMFYIIGFGKFFDVKNEVRRLLSEQ